MELKLYLEIFKKYLKTFFIIILIFLILGIGASLFLYRGNQAIISFKVVQKGQESDQYGGYYSIQADELFVDSFIDWLKTPPIAKTIYQLAGEEVKEKDLPKLAKKISATKISSNQMQVKFQSTDLEKLKKFINSTLTVMDQKNQENLKSQTDSIRTMDLSSSPLIIPIKADYPLVIIVSLLVGIIFGLIGVFTLQYFNPLIITPNFAFDIFGKNLDYIVLSKKDKTFKNLKDKEKEKLRIFRNLFFSFPENKSKSFLFFGADTNKAFNITQVIIESLIAVSKDLLFVEADFKNPKLAKNFNLKRSSGWSDFLAGQKDKLSSLVAKLGDKKIKLLPAGKKISNSADLIEQRGTAKILKGFKNLAKIQIIYGPVYNQFSDSLLFLDNVNETVLIIELGKTKLETVFELGKIFAKKSIQPKLIFIE